MNVIKIKLISLLCGFKDMNILGLDYSTQKLKVLVVDIHGNLIREENVDYDLDLNHYGTNHGVYKREGGIVCAPSIMWIEATDEILNRLKHQIDLSKIFALSGSAQQHTTIFWGKNIDVKLSNLDASVSLTEQLMGAFSKPLSPTWMDSSTEKECYILENLSGGKYELQSRIGSSLEKRFSGPQIMKAFSDDPNLENFTDYITLVSNGMCSLFVGKVVGMDASDAAGTGLQNCKSLNWDLDICSIVSPFLVSKLGEITKGACVVGVLNQYFVKKFQMSPKCKVVSFTGDNPSSVVGMILQEQDLCISLGTSDTLFACLSEAPKINLSIPIFVFPHPLNSEIFVTLLCYKNGSQTREIVRNQYCDSSWEKFTTKLNESIPGNNGIFGIFYDLNEIIPPGIVGRYFQISGNRLPENTSESNIDSNSLVRSLIEGQFYAKYYHFSAISPYSIDSFERLLITGGASVNTSILQIGSDIFNKSVTTISTTNAAAMGSVYRAIAGSQGNSAFMKFVANLHNTRHICDPRNYTIYRDVYPKFTNFFETVMINNL